METVKEDSDEIFKAEAEKLLLSLEYVRFFTFLCKLNISVIF